MNKRYLVLDINKSCIDCLLCEKDKKGNVSLLIKVKKEIFRSGDRGYIYHDNKKIELSEKLTDIKMSLETVFSEFSKLKVEEKVIINLPSDSIFIDKDEENVSLNGEKEQILKETQRRRGADKWKDDIKYENFYTKISNYCQTNEVVDYSGQSSEILKITMSRCYCDYRLLEILRVLSSKYNFVADIVCGEVLIAEKFFNSKENVMMIEFEYDTTSIYVFNTNLSIEYVGHINIGERSIIQDIYQSLKMERNMDITMEQCQKIYKNLRIMNEADRQFNYCVDDIKVDSYTISSIMEMNLQKIDSSISSIASKLKDNGIEISGKVFYFGDGIDCIKGLEIRYKNVYSDVLNVEVLRGEKRNQV